MSRRLILAFRVTAQPRPKGSLTGQSARGTTRVRMIESVDPEGVFRTAVARRALEAFTGIPVFAQHYKDVRAEYDDYRSVSHPSIAEPVELRALFLFHRERGHGSWAPGEGAPRLAVGDIEKLVRNVNDALQDAGVLADDSWVTTLGRVGKRFVDEDAFEEPGVWIELWTDDESAARRCDGDVLLGFQDGAFT